MLRPHKQNAGFTLIEILVVLILVGILSTIVISTYSGVQAKNRNNDRQAHINSLQGQMETYYAEFSKYPSLAEVNSSNWRKTNLKTLNNDTLRDPSWSDKNSNCTLDHQPILASQPATDCFSYQPVAADGSACDNSKIVCAQYTLTAMLTDTGKYTKSSSN